MWLRRRVHRERYALRVCPVCVPVLDISRMGAWSCLDRDISNEARFFMPPKLRRLNRSGGAMAMESGVMMEFRELLDRYRRDSLSEAEKGTKFEQLMRVYLLALPKFQGMFEKVWLWHDFPYRTDFGNGHDIGIDLVVLTVAGEYWAVQVKIAMV